MQKQHLIPTLLHSSRLQDELSPYLEISKQFLRTVSLIKQILFAIAMPSLLLTCGIKLHNHKVVMKATTF